MELEEIGLPMHLAGSCKMELTAFNASVFYVRLENLADDDFDTVYSYYEYHENDTNVDVPVEDEPVVKIPTLLDLDKLLIVLVNKHLGLITGVRMVIEETSLTGGELYTDMVASKTKWSGNSDDYLDQSEYPKDVGRLLSLEAQRIRMFRVSLRPNVSPPSALIQ